MKKVFSSLWVFLCCLLISLSAPMSLGSFSLAFEKPSADKVKKDHKGEKKIKDEGDDSLDEFLEEEGFDSEGDLSESDIEGDEEGSEVESENQDSSQQEDQEVTKDEEDDEFESLDEDEEVSETKKAKVDESDEEEFEEMEGDTGLSGPEEESEITKGSEELEKQEEHQAASRSQIQEDQESEPEPSFSEPISPQPEEREKKEDATSTLAEGKDAPDLEYEARLHQIYLNFYNQKIPQEEWKRIVGSRKSEVYVIKPGDSLWEISQILFGDGNYWPKIWAINSRITNPHLIQPGNQIRFILGDEHGAPAFAITGPEESTSISQTSQEGDGEDEPEIPPPSVVSRPVLKKLPPSLPAWQKFYSGTERSYDQLGISIIGRPKVRIKEQLPLSSYIAETLPWSSGKVVEIEAGDQLANSYQYIYVRMPRGQAHIGDRFLVIKPLGLLEPPNKYVKRVKGYSISVQGEIELTEKIEKVSSFAQQGGEYFRALVLNILNPVSVGSFIVEGQIQQMDMSFKGPIINDNQAQIVGGEKSQKRQLLGKGAIVFLDRGSQSGFKKGQIYPIRMNRRVRRSKSIVVEGLYPIGYLKIVKVSPHLSTAVILKAKEGIYVGDFIGNGMTSLDIQRLSQGDEDLMDDQFDEDVKEERDGGPQKESKEDSSLDEESLEEE
ncbi:MAG: LysM peptidoglycan-binding domain-containing protein [Bdellovibrio sp.]|nr:MAG: LysM peptidoglycan-binding domain-containing protein [Bdellovibrio sp.]